MKLIIDIPEEMYSNILTVGAWYIVDVPILGEAIMKGVPLEDIKAEIKAIQKEDLECDGCSDMGMVLDIINKHIGDMG